MSKRGTYNGGSTIVTVNQSDKRMAARQKYWRHKLGPKVEQSLHGVLDEQEPPRLIPKKEKT